MLTINDRLVQYLDTAFDQANIHIGQMDRTLLKDKREQEQASREYIMEKGLQMQSVEDMAQKLLDIGPKDKNDVLYYNPALTENDFALLRVLENRKDLFEKEKDFYVDANGQKFLKPSKSQMRIQEL